MSMQAEHHCWRIRKGIARAFFLILIPYAALLVVRLAGLWDGEPAAARYLMVIFPAAAFPLLGFMYCYRLLLAITISREGITLKYPLRKEVFPLSAIKGVYFSSYSWPFCRDRRAATIRIENSKLGLITVRESWYHCEPGEVERVLRAYYPDAIEAIDAYRISLSEVAGVSSGGKTEGDALPVGYSVRRRFNGLSQWLCRAFAITLIVGFAMLGTVCFGLTDAELPARWVGVLGAWFAALYVLWGLCFREILEIAISPKGIAFRYPFGSRSFPRDAIKRVNICVFNGRAGRAPKVAVWLRIRGRLALVRFSERLGSDVIKALASNFANVCDAHKTRYAAGMCVLNGKKTGRALGDGTQIAH